MFLLCIYSVTKNRIHWTNSNKSLKEKKKIKFFDSIKSLEKLFFFIFWLKNLDDGEKKDKNVFVRNTIFFLDTKSNFDSKIKFQVGFHPFRSGQSMCPERLFAKNAIQISILIFFSISLFQSQSFARNSKWKKNEGQGIDVSHPKNDIPFSFKYL
jgi:hypothetical protein